VRMWPGLWNLNDDQKTKLNRKGRRESIYSTTPLQSSSASSPVRFHFTIMTFTVASIKYKWLLLLTLQAS
jgi:hypothetical protein